MKKYKVEIRYFSDKVYKVDNIQDILDEVKIFTDIENIVNITEMTTKEIKSKVFDMLHNLTYQKLEGNFKSDIESEQQDEMCELMADILIDLAKDPIEFHLNAYNKGIINAEDCVQAIDEMVNGVTKAPTT